MDPDPWRAISLFERQSIINLLGALIIKAVGRKACQVKTFAVPGVLCIRGTDQLLRLLIKMLGEGSRPDAAPEGNRQIRICLLYTSDAADD